MSRFPALTTAIVSVAALVGLAACGEDPTEAEGASETQGAPEASENPTDALEGYIAALNEGDAATALSHVVNQEDVEPELIQIPSGDLPAPHLADSTEVTDEMTSARLDYTYGSDTSTHRVSFLKEDDSWMLAEPEFIQELLTREYLPADWVATMHNAGYSFVDASGESYFDEGQTHVVVNPEEPERDLTAEVDNSQFWEPFTMEIRLNENIVLIDTSDDILQPSEALQERMSEITTMETLGRELEDHQYDTTVHSVGQPDWDSCTTYGGRDENEDNQLVGAALFGTDENYEWNPRTSCRVDINSTSSLYDGTETSDWDIYYSIKTDESVEFDFSDY